MNNHLDITKISQKKQKLCSNVMPLVLRRAVHPGLRRDHHQAALAVHRVRLPHPALPAAAAAMIVPDQKKSKYNITLAGPWSHMVHT